LTTGRCGGEYSDKREEVTEGYTKLHNEKLHNLYSSSNTIRIIKSIRIRWMGHVVRIIEMRNAYNIFAGKSERKTPLERPRHTWDDIIKMDLKMA
jgi:hypothetical protein